MEIIIAIIIIAFIVSAIKEFISDHKEGILKFLGAVGGIGAIVFCVMKFGFWAVVKVLLLILGLGIIGTLAWTFISVLIDEYYDRKAVRTEENVRAYVFGQSKRVNYDTLRSTVINQFGNIRLGKKHDVMDYINQAIDDFTKRNRRDAIAIIVTDIKQKICVIYNDYYDNIKGRIGSYCIGNISFKSLVDNTLNEFAIKQDLSNVIYYIEKNASLSDKNFQCASYKLTVINDDDDDDDDDDFDDDGYDYNEKQYENHKNKLDAEDVPLDIRMAADKSIDHRIVMIDDEDDDEEEEHTDKSSYCLSSENLYCKRDGFSSDTDNDAERIDAVRSLAESINLVIQQKENGKKG